MKVNIYAKCVFYALQNQLKLMNISHVDFVVSDYFLCGFKLFLRVKELWFLNI